MSQEISSKSEFLLVPINVQGFVVGTRGQPLYDLAPVPRNEADLAHWYLENKHSFSFQNKLPSLAPGIHLHWTLPAAMMHTRHQGTDEPEQHCIPNRWFVLRLWHAPGASTICSKAWVLESDYVSLSADSGSAPFPFFEPNPPAELNGNHCGFVGRAVPAEQWEETHKEYRFKLTSFGWGDPSFPAYYPACQGVLGFHDKLDDLPQGDLTYLVVGWYSDSREDPLNPEWQPAHSYDIGDIVRPSLPNGHLYRVIKAGTSAASEPSWSTEGTVVDGTVNYAANAELLGTLNWSCPKLAGAVLPRRTLCHGGLVNIQWQGLDRNYGTGSVGTASSATVAIGDSAAEAFAALLAPGEASVQQALVVFQHGQASQASDFNQLGDLLHRDGFSAVPGGKRWSIEPVARRGVAEGAPLSLSAEFQNSLRRLNRTQRAVDRQTRTVESLRGRLFACWVTWAGKQLGPPGQRPTRAAVDALTADVRKATARLSTYEQVIRVRIDQLRDALTRKEPRMELADSTLPPFLHPNDPFVVLSGEKLSGVERAHPQPPDSVAENPLRCRLETEVVTGMELSGAIQQEWQAGACFELRIPGGILALPRELILALAFEILLFDPKSAALLEAGRTKLFPRALFKILQETLAAQRELEGETLRWEGQPPDSLGVTRRGEGNPWLPAYLVWQARWRPTYTTGEGPEQHRRALDGWELRSGPPATDLVPAKGSMQPGNEVVLEGATMITTFSGTQLAENLSGFAKTAGRKADGLDRIRRMQVLGQSLGGFNDRLLRRALGLCSPPVNPRSKQIDAAVWDALGRRPQPTIPANGVFLPLRAGTLTLVNLCLVDSFGQTSKLVDSATKFRPRNRLIASAMLPSAPRDCHARFNPRLVQPARLNFNWRPAEDTSASGPVCGWVVANFLDKSFAVFSASGKALGALESVLPELGAKTIDSKVTFNWQAAPGTALKINDISDARLRRFLNLATKFNADEGQMFLELVDLVLRKTEGRVPVDDPAMAILLGRPLALVHASLGLEVEGLPAGYWKTDGAWTYTTEGFERLRVPVRLGGIDLAEDGLIGYLTDSDASPLFATHGVGLPEQSSERMRYDQGLAMACADPRPVSLLLLMDAGALVHASTGILPRQSIVLPPEAARQADLIEEIYFSVAPVLGEKQSDGESQPAMPKPSDAFGQWSWATRPELTWQQIRAAGDRAHFANDLVLSEGWLRLRRNKPAPRNERKGVNP